VYFICGTLREEQRVRVYENRVLRKIFGSKREQVTGEWRKKTHNEELCDPYNLTKYYECQFKKNEMGEAYSACRGKTR
jgi:hypothetical protein